jgi:hypothetical protein
MSTNYELWRADQAIDFAESVAEDNGNDYISGVVQIAPRAGRSEIYLTDRELA